MHTIAIVVYDNVNPFQLGIVTEIFGIAPPALKDSWYRLLVCSTETRPLQTAGGLSFVTPYTLKDVSEADTVIVPSSRPYVAEISDQLRDTLQTSYRRGARLISFCTGVFLLAAVGALNGRRVATHWGWSDRLAKLYPEVRVDPRALYVDDCQVLTSAGTGAAIDLALYIVRQDYGSAIATDVARRMIVPLQRQGNQSQFIETPFFGSSEDEPFNTTLTWLGTNLDKNLTINQMAARSLMSPRTFTRRFQETLGIPPHQWLLYQRISLAQRLLETTNEPVEFIAIRSGFNSAATFRNHFQRFLHLSPLAYRASFKNSPAPKSALSIA